MAEFMTFTPEQQSTYEEWVSARPAAIQAVIRRLPPNKLYRNRETNQRVTIVSYEEMEDGTCKTLTVAVLAKYNACVFERSVFGVSVDDLEECPLPPEGEVVGALLTTQKDVDAFIEINRPAVLPARGLQKEE